MRALRAVDGDCLVSHHMYIWCKYQVAYKSMFCRVSAANLARAYDADTPDRENRIPISWRYSLDMNTGTVWDAFFLHGLIMDSLDREETLELPHNGEDQSTRIDVALEHRNVRMVGPGQEYWNHACSRCCEISEDNTSKG